MFSLRVSGIETVLGSFDPWLCEWFSVWSRFFRFPWVSPHLVPSLTVIFSKTNPTVILWRKRPAHSVVLCNFRPYVLNSNVSASPSCNEIEGPMPGCWDLLTLWLIFIVEGWWQSSFFSQTADTGQPDRTWWSNHPWWLFRVSTNDLHWHQGSSLAVWDVHWQSLDDPGVVFSCVGCPLTEPGRSRGRL